MYLKIYFVDKPVFLCDKVDNVIKEYMHHPDTVFIDEISTPAINSLLHEMAKPEFHAGILLDKDLAKLKKAFFKHFTLIKAGGGVIENGNKQLLLIFRREKWDLPKGKLDKNETIEQCAIRECKEETGLSGIELLEKITVTYHTYQQFGKHILKESHWFKMKYSGNENPVPQTEEDITEIEWVKRNDLEKFSDTYSTIREVLNQIK